MSTATTIAHFLDAHEIPYDMVTHSRTFTSLQAARAAHIEPRKIAKAVVLCDKLGSYVMAILPASNRLQLGEVRSCLGRDVGMATEREVAELFPDCDPGAVPAFGPAYGMETVWDESLADLPDVYVESGDHEHLLHMDAQQFMSLLDECPHGALSKPALH